MKTYDEMAQSALERGKALRKQRKKWMLIGVVSVCCLVCLLAFAMGRTGQQPGPTDGSLSLGEKETEPKPTEGVLNLGDKETAPPPTETQPKPEDVTDPPPTETQPKSEEEVTDPLPTETQPKPEEDVTDPPPTETQPKPEEEVTDPPPTETQPKPEEDVTDPPPTETQPKPEEDVTDPPPTETQPKPEEDVTDPPPTETQPKPEEDVTDPPPTETQPKPEEDVTDPPPTETQPKPEEDVTDPPPTETQPKPEEDVTDPPPTETQPKPEEDVTVPQLPEIIPGYGPITYLTVTNQAVGGKAFLGSGLSGGGSQSGPPQFGFRHGYIHVLARAVEEYPEIYESLNDYGSAKTARYRLFRMEVIDPLDSGLEGDFYYVLPAHLKGDLTKYDALLISMEQLVKNYVLRHGDQLTAFEYLFADPGDHPELGNMIAFTDGIFDESLWQDKSWNYGYQFGRDYLDVEYRDKLIGGKAMLVERGSTLEEALRRRQEQADKWNGWPQNTQVQQVVFPKEEAKAAMEYVKPFVNGVFAPVRSKGYYYRRYINGCPTNEWIGINDGTVSTSEYRFEAEELEGLPDLSAYIAKLDLSKLQPPDADRGDIAFENVTVVGSYEKSADGVRAVVEIAWRQYIPEIGKWVDADDTLISLDENGTVLFCREDLKELFGVH